jgi:hypothetical protein
MIRSRRQQRRQPQQQLLKASDFSQSNLLPQQLQLRPKWIE